MTVAVVTDSATALPADVLAAHDITVVPMWLTVADQAVREGERSLGEILGDERVTTSGPTPGEFEATFRALLASDGVDEVLACTVSSEMSATYEAASVAARDVGEQVHVVDTKTAAGAQALVVLAAARTAAAGGSLEAAESAARRVCGTVRLVATLPTLDHLVRGGRVPAVAGWAGRHLGINPLFEFSDGRIRKLRPALSADAAHERIVAACVRSRPDEQAGLNVVAMHALARPVAEELLDRVTADIQPADAFIGEFGSVMVVHTGPGLAGLAWWWEPGVGPGQDPTVV
ncbi:MAG: DegV family protein [Acidimicrobiia bacterium]